MFRRGVGAWLLAAALPAVVAALPAAPAAAAMTAKQAGERVAGEFGVRVLKVEPGQYRGRAAFFVTVMNPGGNFNEAFQVSRIAVDAETGALLSAVRHRTSGYEGSGASSRSATPEPAESMRPSANGTR